MRKLLLLPLISLLGCGTGSQQDSSIPLSHTDHEAVEDSSRQVADSLAEAFTPTLDSLNLSPAPKTPWKLLMEGTYHKQEVWAGAERLTWFGLYFKDGAYQLLPTTVTVNIVKDPVAEKVQGVHSGRQVVSSLPEAAFLVSARKGISAGPVDTASYNRTTLPAQRQLKLSFANKTYTLSAFGDSTVTADSTFKYTKYGWQISGYRKGKLLKQTLAEGENFEDSIYVLLWAGDLDRDGIPDLLIDLSNHYNVSRYTLFLSSLAERGKLYKKAAVFETIGS